MGEFVGEMYFGIAEYSSCLTNLLEPQMWIAARSYLHGFAFPPALIQKPMRGQNAA